MKEQLIKSISTFLLIFLILFWWGNFDMFKRIDSYYLDLLNLAQIFLILFFFDSMLNNVLKVIFHQFLILTYQLFSYSSEYNGILTKLKLELIYNLNYVEIFFNNNIIFLNRFLLALYILTIISSLNLIVNKISTFLTNRQQ
ncbi:MAG: hypothetical protein CFE22_11285 [Cytophagaceae bacterium BCCC1]|nr:MAG: hypothetical protein CFE22_11285 [Cytophagaceae bacterium BCCC1]